MPYQRPSNEFITQASSYDLYLGTGIVIVDVIYRSCADLRQLIERIHFFFFSSRRRHTRYWRDWSSDVCSSDLLGASARPRPGSGATRGREGPVARPELPP